MNIALLVSMIEAFKDTTGELPVMIGLGNKMHEALLFELSDGKMIPFICVAESTTILGVPVRTTTDDPWVIVLTSKETDDGA